MPATVIPLRRAPFAARQFVTVLATDTPPAGSETSFQFDPARQVTVDVDGRPRTHAGTITYSSPGSAKVPREMDESPQVPKPRAATLW